MSDKTGQTSSAPYAIVVPDRQQGAPQPDAESHAHESDEALQFATVEARIATEADRVRVAAQTAQAAQRAAEEAQVVHETQRSAIGTSVAEQVRNATEETRRAVEEIQYAREWLPKANMGASKKKPFPPSKAHKPGPSTAAQASDIFDLLSILIPRRIANEELGDALEVIHQMEKEGRPKWYIHMKIATTTFWVFVHTLMHYAERAVTSLRTATAKGGDKA